MTATMKLAAVTLAWTILGVVGCGGPDDGDRSASGEVQSAAAGGVAEDRECVPMVPCEPDRPLFCDTSAGTCHLRYPDGRELAVSCKARPTPPPQRNAQHCK